MTRTGTHMTRTGTHMTHTGHASDPHEAEFGEIMCEIAEDLEIAENFILEHAFVTYICCTSYSYSAEFEEIMIETAEDLEIAASRDAPSSRMNESWHTYEQVVLHMQICHVTNHTRKRPIHTQKRPIHTQKRLVYRQIDLSTRP